MGYYGNNLVAWLMHGSLIYVDEPEATDSAETPFEEVTVLGRDFLLEQLAVDGVYQPGILNRAIKAIPKYVNDDDLTEPIIRHRSPRLEIKVPNDQSNGIIPSEFDTGQMISIPPRKGADARSFTLARIVRQTAAFVTFEAH